MEALEVPLGGAASVLGNGGVGLGSAPSSSVAPASHQQQHHQRPISAHPPVHPAHVRHAASSPSLGSGTHAVRPASAIQAGYGNPVQGALRPKSAAAAKRANTIVNIL